MGIKIDWENEIVPNAPTGFFEAGFAFCAAVATESFFAIFTHFSLHSLFTSLFTSLFNSLSISLSIFLSTSRFTNFSAKEMQTSLATVPIAFAAVHKFN